MNKFRKIMAGIAVAVGLGCLVGAGACATGKAPTYYDLLFDANNVDIIMLGDLGAGNLDEFGNPFDAINGGKVAEGTEIKFTVSVGNNTTGTLKIFVNGEELKPDANGVYTFVITKNSSVKVEGIAALYQLNLHRAIRVQDSNGNYGYEERLVDYLDVDGKVLDEYVMVSEADDFKFKLDVAPYYVKENDNGGTAYSVICDSQELMPDNDGVYTVTGITEIPEGGVDVYLSNLEQEEPFTSRGNCGSGTESDPFLLSRPIDLFQLAGLTNLELYNDIYGRAYYKLVDDIDLEGTQMYVIGDSSNEGYGEHVFSGNFDGNGHTIKNFYITDEVVEQETFQEAYLPYLGMFGYTSALTSRPVTIKNLTLENCELRVHTALADQPVYAGMIVGYGIGTQIYNCNVKNATITVTGSDSYQTFAGGAVGVLQAAYGQTRTGTVSYDSYVHATNVSNLNMSGTGSLRVVGGVAGYVISSDISAISYVSNCTVTGDVIGGWQTGGIAGASGRLSTIVNCYVDAVVYASNAGEQYSEEYSYAYAGGILGYADEDSLIHSCYVAHSGDVTASSAKGNNYKAQGTYAGYIAKGGDAAIDAQPALIINNKCDTDGALSAVLAQLGWTEREWTLTGTPASKLADGNRTVKITVKKADGSTVGEYTKVLGATRYTLNSWYAAGNIPEYLTESNLRTHGYYFTAADGKVEGRVPYGFVPSADETVLYVGFTNYAEVAGEYYVQAAPRSNGAYLTLSEDGVAVFRNGGMVSSGAYYYDGETVTIPFSSMASLFLDIVSDSGSKYGFVGTKIDGGLQFKGVAYATEISFDNNGNQKVEQTAVTLTFSMFKEREELTYGAYGTTSGDVYTFNVGMNGTYKAANGNIYSFTYNIEGNTIKAVYTDTSRGGFNATISGGKITVVNGSSVTKLNQFYGTYKRSANSVTGFTFDGITSVNGVDYTVEQNRAIFTINDVRYEAFFNQEGFLEINGVVYYPADGFTGEWYFEGVSGSLEKIDLKLEGITSEGFGYATVDFIGGSSVSAQYDVLVEGNVSTLRIYAGDVQYGEITIVDGSKIARGIFFSQTTGGYYDNITFNLYDALKGVWVSNADGIDTIIFSGKTTTGINTATIRSESGAISRGTYTLDAQAKGTLTIGNDVYELSYDEVANKIELKKTGADKTLAQRDNWYGTVLYDGDTTYTFDGKGYIGGKVTVSDGTTLTYKIENGEVTMNGTKLVPNSGKTAFTYGAKTLVFKTGFAGEWLVGSTQKKLTLTEVGTDFTATASFEGVDGTYAFTYNPTNGTLTYVEIINGQEWVTVLKTSGSFELTLTRTGDGILTLNCIISSKQDAYMGVYEAEDGSSWTLDGLGNCVSGNGLAIYKAPNGDVTSYYYRINATGTPYINALRRGFVKTKDGYKKGGAGQAYDMVSSDSLYQQRVISNDNSYIFDGFGKLYRINGDSYVEEYDYEIVDSQTVTLKKDNKTYVGKLSKQGVNTTLTITEQA